MEQQIKSETIKIVTPVGTRFRYSWLVEPDEYKGVKKWKTEAIIPVGSKVTIDGKEHEATSYISDKLSELIESWKQQLKAAYPKREFTLTKNKDGKPSFPFAFEEDGLVIRLKKNYLKASGGTNKPIVFFKHDSESGQNLLMTDEEKQDMIKISPQSTGQISFLAQGYDAGANGVGIRCMPLSICFREIVTNNGADDFETTPAAEPSSYEEKETVSTGADF
tara:strand:+ start:476 stop:1138 length:663 start_codon:yes stop_codon:yes gene_type:complete